MDDDFSKASANRSDRLAASAFIGLLVAATFASVPFLRAPLGESLPFFAIYGVVLGASELATSAFLVWRASVVGSNRLAVLAAAYAFSAPLIIANVSAIPGLFGRQWPPQSAPWLWVGWHLGWPVVIAAWCTMREGTARRVWLAPAVGFGAAILLEAAMRTVPLPVLVRPDLHFTPLFLGLYACALVAQATALAMLLFRPRALSTLGLWVGVAMVTITLDTVLTVLGFARFSLGFYLARSFGLVSGCIVLTALTASFARLVARADLVDASERRLRTMLDAVPQIIWTARADGWVDWYNGAWFAFTGQTRAEAAGWGWQAAHHAEDFPGVMQRWPHSIATGEPFEMEFRLCAADGSYSWFLTRVVPERDEAGRVVRWLGTNTNIDAQKQQLQRSAHIAQTMQRAILPDVLPTPRGASLDALYLPAESDALVGGDWYDATQLPDGRVLITCGDVIGHGIAAAIVAGRYRQSIALSATDEPDPSRILARVNRVAVLNGDAIATAVVAVADPATGSVAYALAGHPPPIVGSTALLAHALPPAGMPLGIDGGAAFTTQCVTLRDRAIVAFYTDGLLEFDRDALRSEVALCTAIDALVGSDDPHPAATIRDAVMGDAVARDDVAILTLTVGDRENASAFAAPPPTKTWRFHSSDARSAQNARRTLVAFLRVYALDGEPVADAETIIGEALANTVAHAPGLVEVTIHWPQDRPTLVVLDSGPGLAAPTVDGRGLTLIRALAADLVVRGMPGAGVELRCTLPVRRAPDADHAPRSSTIFAAAPVRMRSNASS